MKYKDTPSPIKSWDYRLIARDGNLDGRFSIHEVFYDEAGEAISWVEDAAAPFGDSVTETRRNLDQMRLAFAKTALVPREVDGKEVLLPEPTEKVELGEFYCHEALDRTWVFAEMFGNHVAMHPVIEQTPHLNQFADTIGEALGALYQAIGNLGESADNT